jgi:lipopolysaccharide biosynthesis glycosyltransferase
MSDLPPIVFGVDDGFLEPLLVVLCSIAETHPDRLDDLTVHVLHTGLSAGNVTRLGRHADAFGLRLRTAEVRVAPGRYPLTGRATEATYLRLEIARHVDADRALYLDADTLVTGDLRPLLRTPMGGRPIGAVRDPQNPIVGHGIGLPGWADLGLPADREYFNSGVLLLDLAECRRIRFFERCAAFLTDHPRHVKFWDQDALNYVADDDWLRLERRWNTFPMSAILRLPGDQYRAEHIFPVAQLIADEPGAHILHFAGVGKPWLGRLPDGDINRRYAAARERALNAYQPGHR